MQRREAKARVQRDRVTDLLSGPLLEQIGNMLSAVIVSANVVVSSLFFGFALLIAWREFNLQRHVALWAVSFIAAAMGDGLRIGGGLLPHQQALFAMLACHASVASFACLAWGFQDRAKRGAQLVLGCWAVAILVLASAWLSQGIDWRTDWRTDSRIMTAASDAVMIGIIVLTMRPTGGSGRLARWTLALYGVYIACVGAAAWLARPGGEIADATFIVVLSIGTPTGIIGSGIVTLLIVAADLARGLRNQARTDALTGLLNRRGLDGEAKIALRSAEASRSSSVVVTADLDHFKAINDRYGHAAGDQVLKAFARLLRTMVRPEDVVGRTGGEEFVVLLLNIAEEDALRRVETIRAAVPSALDTVPGVERVTASFGIAVVQRGQSFDSALARADAALYESKRNGRDRATIAA